MKFSTIILIVIGLLLFTLCMFGLFEPSTDPTGFFVYTPRIAILNPGNSQPINSSLEIGFITRGTNELAITPLKGNAEILELKCNDKILNKGGNNLVYKDYKCKGDSIAIIKILSGDLNLEFRFGKETQQARNTAP